MTATVTGPASSSETPRATEELMHLDPNEVLIDDNVRDEVDPDMLADLMESVREYGVLVALRAVRYADGTVAIEDGQCRALVARDAGLPTIPVLVHPDTATTDTERAINRIKRQLHTYSRGDLTTGQRAASVALLLDLGESEAATAKAVRGVPRDQIKAAAAVGKSVTARTAIDAGQLSMEQAAIVAEFEIEGDTEAVDQLMNAGHWNIRYTAQRLRNDRAEKAERAEAAQPYTVMGYTILAEEPDYGRDLLLADLVNADGGEVTEAHTQVDPNKWAVWLSKDERYFLREGGEEIDGEEVDWATEDDDEATPDEGHRHANTVETRQVWLPEYVCLDPEGAGVALSPILAAARSAAPAEGGESDEDAAVAAARREAEAKERQRQERRQVIALNKQAEAATTVRRDYLRTTLLARKTPPKGAAGFVATALARDPGLLTEGKTDEVVRELLGITAINTGTAIAELVAKASDNRAQVITLALVIAAQEARMVKDAWRSHPKGTDRYLTFLAENDHTLTQVEEVAAGTLTADQTDID